MPSIVSASHSGTVADTSRLPFAIGGYRPRARNGKGHPALPLLRHRQDGANPDFARIPLALHATAGYVMRDAWKLSPHHDTAEVPAACAWGVVKKRKGGATGPRAPSSALRVTAKPRRGYIPQRFEVRLMASPPVLLVHFPGASAFNPHNRAPVAV